MSEITLDELMAEYKRLGLDKDDEGLTSDEYAERWGISKSRAMLRLRQAGKLGWLKNGVRKAMRMDGRPMWIPVYRITIPKAKAKAKK